MELITSLLFWILAISGVILTGISKSGFAGGAGVVAVPLLALVMPVSDAVVIMLPVLLIMDIKMVQYYAKAADWSIIKTLLPGAMLGIVVGGFMLGTLSDRVLEIALAAICIVFASWHRLTPILSRFKGSGAFWSIVSGFSSTMIHAGGPPINLYLLSLKPGKLKWLATSAFFFGAMNLAKIIPYSLNAQWSTQGLLYSALLAPAAILGVGLGKRIQHRLSEQMFLTACRYLLLASGLILAFKALL